MSLHQGVQATSGNEQEQKPQSSDRGRMPPPKRPNEQLDRRTSVQFVAPAKDTGNTNSSLKAVRPIATRRASSPPPPAPFESRVSFDTFDNKDAVDYSLTLNSKHKDYTYSRRSRTFLVGIDQNDYSENALEWLIDELVDNGDEVVCLRVVDKDAKISSDTSMEEGRYRAEAKGFLDWIITKNPDGKAISLVLEFAVGKVHNIIQRMIQVYEPSILIVGTRGRGLQGFQGLLPGSISKYCLQHSPIPVIVVKPSSKRDKKKAERKNDPSRQGYLNVLSKSGVGPGKKSHMADGGDPSRSSLEVPTTATDREAQAVAAAIGLIPGYDEIAGLTDADEIDAQAQTPSKSGLDPDTEHSPQNSRVLRSPRLPTDASSTVSTDSDSDEAGGDDDDDDAPHFETPYRSP